jgi:hypothetical protein
MAGNNTEHYCHYIEKVCKNIESDKVAQGVFFAYPSDPETSADAIRGAIKQLNDNKDLGIKALDWTELPIEGNIIFCEICRAINSLSCSAVNTTYVNFNVLFEYGFAIGSGRAIWPLVEEGVAKDELVSTNIKSVTTIGYSQFSNSNSIVKKIIKKQPWNRNSHFDLPKVLGNEPTREATGLLYLKSAQDNEPSLRISEVLSSVPFELVTDDPNEVPFRHIAWYLAQIGKAYAVVIHLGNERMIGAKFHWAKCALVGGMALALGRRVFILGENISLEPIDYRDLMKSYKNAQEAETDTKRFIEKIQPTIVKFREYISHDITAPGAPKGTMLASVDLGDYVAENELLTLQHYFVETPEFFSGLRPRCSVFVGRKGSGKSANYYMIANRLLKKKSNLVCLIKPKEYQLNELIQFIKNELDSANKGYLLESLWKYMLYSEALITVNNRIIERGIEENLLGLTEKKIFDYFKTSHISSDISFTSRLVEVVRDLCEIKTGNMDIKTAVSEILHAKEIGRMHDMLCKYIVSMDLSHFGILIDGLDANWRMGEDHDIISDVLLSLMGASKDIWRECNKDIINTKNWQGVSIGIFIRSDVFSVALERARDPDKLQYESISWNNVDSLVNMVALRIMAGWTEIKAENLNWDDILEPSFGYDDMKMILSNNVLPRPRDFIYYFQRVIYNARSRGTKYLTKRDFQSALNEYSQWVLLSLSAEAQPYIPNMFDLLLDFDLKRAVLTTDEIDKILLKAGVNEKDLRRATNFLVDINFLGYGIDANNYRFPSSPSEETIMKRRFLRHTRGDYALGKFKIHNAFHPVLTIQ